MGYTPHAPGIVNLPCKQRKPRRCWILAMKHGKFLRFVFWLWCMLLSKLLPFCIAQNQRNNIIHLNACIMIVTPKMGFKGLVQWHMMAPFKYRKLGTQNEYTVDLILNQDLVGYNHPGIKGRRMKLVDRTSLNGIFMGIFYTGWWHTYPSEKYDFVSWMMKFPASGNIESMFQTTNQYRIYCQL